MLPPMPAPRELAVLRPRLRHSPPARPAAVAHRWPRGAPPPPAVAWLARPGSAPPLPLSAPVAGLPEPGDQHVQQAPRVNLSMPLTQCHPSQRLDERDRQGGQRYLVRPLAPWAAPYRARHRLRARRWPRDRQRRQDHAARRIPPGEACRVDSGPSGRHYGRERPVPSHTAHSGRCLARRVAMAR